MSDETNRRETAGENNELQWFSSPDFQRYLDTFLAEAPGPIEQKYMVVLVVLGTPYYYPVAAATDHRHALNVACAVHANKRFPVTGADLATVFGYCSDPECGCGETFHWVRFELRYSIGEA